MARVTGKGISGKVGDLVYFVRNGKQFVKAAAGARLQKPLTPSQAQQLLKSRKAVKYAKQVVKNPELLAIYEAAKKGHQTGYNLAIRDARISPEVLCINAQYYYGNPDDVILVVATDDFKVDTVTLIILDQTGDIVEEGKAVLSPRSLEWCYTTTTLNLEITGCKIVAIARDLPGNKGTLEVKL